MASRDATYEFHACNLGAIGQRQVSNHFDMMVNPAGLSMSKIWGRLPDLVTESPDRPTHAVYYVATTSV